MGNAITTTLIPPSADDDTVYQENTPSPPDMPEADKIDMDVSIDPNDALRDGLESCNCDCCVNVERLIETASTNWTCAPAYRPEQSACDLSGIQTCSSAAGTDKGEAFDYDLFCTTHCKGVATEINTQCTDLEPEELALAKDAGGNWIDPRVMSVEEAGSDSVLAAKLANEPAPPTSSPLEQDELKEQKNIVDALYADGGPIHAAGIAHENIKKLA